MSLLTLLMLASGFGNMHIDIGMQTLIFFGDLSDKALIGQIFRMQAELRNHPVIIILKVLYYIYTLIKPVLRYFFSLRERQTNTADITLYTRTFKHFPCSFRKIIHFRYAGSTTGQHFHHCPALTDLDILGSQLGLYRENGCLQPLLQGESSADTSEKCHRSVPVSINQTGHKYHTAHILFSIALRCVPVRTYVLYILILYTYTASFENLKFSVLTCGKYNAACQFQTHFFFLVVNIFRFFAGDSTVKAVKSYLMTAKIKILIFQIFP